MNKRLFNSLFLLMIIIMICTGERPFAPTAYAQTPLGTTEVWMSLHDNLNGFGKWNQIPFADDTTQTTAAISGAPTDATFITQTADGDLSNEQAMGDLGTGIVKNTTTTGVQSIAVAGTDYSTSSATETLTNKTIDANGTGNSITNIDLTADITGILPVANGGTNASSAGITAFNNITGYTATGATGTTSTNVVFSTSPILTTPDLGTPSALVGTNITGLAASQISIAEGVGSPTIDQIQEYLDNTGSSGYFEGGTLSDGGAGTLDVTAGSGFIRASASDTAPILSFKWSASSTIAVADNTTQYVFVDDAGTITLNSDEFLEAQDNILLGLVTDDAGAITSIFNLGVRLQESIGQAGRFIRRTLGVVRDIRRGGLIYGQSGDANRDVTMTTGHLWWGRTDYTISAFDTSGADTFDTYSSSGLEASGASTWPNGQYDNAGTLTALTSNRWANLYFYIIPNDLIVMVYGRAQYTSEALAAEEIVPSASLPNLITAAGVLAARFSFQESANSATIRSAFDTVFAANGVTDHGNLAGLGDDDHTQYLLADGTRALAGAWDMGSQATTNVNIDSGVITGITDLAVADGGTGVSTSTGTTNAVLSNSPTLVTPEIGVATGTSLDVGASILATRSLTVDTGGVFNVALSAAAGDDFTIDTDKFLVEGDTGNIGVGTDTPTVALDVWDDSGTDAVISVHSGDHTEANDYLRTSHDQTNPTIDYGNGSLQIQGITDSITGVQILDSDGGTPIFNVDTTNERVGIGTAAPLGPFHIVTDSQEAYFDSYNNGAGTKLDLTLRRARGTSGSPLVVQDGDRVGELRFFGYNDNIPNFDIAAAIGCRIDGEPATGADTSDMPGRMEFYTTLDGSGLDLDNPRMVIKNDGLIGIGNLSPGSLLDVRGAAGADGRLTLSTAELTIVDGDKLGQIDWQAPLESSGTDAILVGASIWAEADADFEVGTNTTDLVFATANSETAAEKMRLDSGGNLVVTGDIKANTSNFVVEGYTTGRNILRSVVLQLEPGATPATNINVTDDSSIRGFNTPTITDATDLAKSGTVGSFSLDAPGTSLTLDITENVIGIISTSIQIHDINSSSTTEMYTLHVAIVSSNLSITIRKRGAIAAIDLTTILDADDRCDILIGFITSS